MLKQSRIILPQTIGESGGERHPQKVGNKQAGGTYVVVFKGEDGGEDEEPKHADGNE